MYSIGTGVVYIGHSAVVGMPWPVDQESRVSGTPSLGNGMSRGHLGRGCCAVLADSSLMFVARTLNQHIMLVAVSAWQPCTAYAHTFIACAPIFLYLSYYSLHLFIDIALHFVSGEKEIVCLLYLAYLPYHTRTYK